MSKSITQKLKYKQSVVKFSYKYGVIKAVIKYQYTAIDEYTRIRYVWVTNEHDTYASTEFLERLVKVFSFKIEKGPDS